MVIECNFCWNWKETLEGQIKKELLKQIIKNGF